MAFLMVFILLVMGRKCRRLRVSCVNLMFLLCRALEISLLNLLSVSSGTVSLTTRNITW